MLANSSADSLKQFPQPDQGRKTSAEQYALIVSQFLPERCIRIRRSISWRHHGRPYHDT
jgi:hypothetical protein